MSNPIPSSLALTSIADKAYAIASVLRNNYADIQDAVNGLITALSGGSSGQLLSATDSSHVAWVDAATVYRKTTAETVTDSTVETDLLNGEITVGAGVLGTDRAVRLTAWGDWILNTGAANGLPRFKVKLGASPTTVIDTNATAATVAASSASRYGWRISVEIQNLGAANSQLVVFRLDITLASNGATSPTAFATGEGNYQPQNGYAKAAWFAAAAIDTTAAMNVLLTVINPTSGATCETKLAGALVEVI